jgi:hypothetical protein
MGPFSRNFRSFSARLSDTKIKNNNTDNRCNSLLSSFFLENRQLHILCGVSKNLQKRSQVDKDSCSELFDTQAGLVTRVSSLSKKWAIFL